MKSFKLDIPDSRVEFVLDLLQRFEFCKIEGLDSSEEIEVKLKRNSPRQSSSDEDKKSLQMALERLTQARDKNLPKICKFRYPTQSLKLSQGELKTYTKIKDLKDELAAYFRVVVDDVIFELNKGEKVEYIDTYTVYIQVKDESSKKTKIMVGYADYAFD